MPKEPQLPGSVCTIPELFTYNPDRAKEILAEAGYPEGFKTVIQCTSDHVDTLAIVQNYLEKVGVVMDLEVMESGSYSSIKMNDTIKEMYYGGASGIWAPFEQLMTKTGMKENFVNVDDPYYAEVGVVIGRDMVKNPDLYFKTLKAEGLYELESAWGIWMPMRYTYVLWHPWVGNYMGINWTGWAGQNDWKKSIWVDEDIKKSMGY